MARVLTPETLDKIEQACSRYPTRLAAMLPALHLVQDQLGYISPDAELDVAETLDVPPTRVREVVTFYTMFYQVPQGRHVLKICRNLACQLRGAGKLMAHAQEKLGIGFGETTEDGRISLEHEECLASCGTGPMLLWAQRGSHEVQVVENLTEARFDEFVEGLK